MGTCESKDGKPLVNPDKSAPWTEKTCIAAGGYKLNGQVNYNYPCGIFTTCNGTEIASTQVGGKACGPKNIEYYCISSATGGQWRESGMQCDSTSEGAAGMCATSCGPMTTCGGDKITKSRIGATECGEGNKTYVCAPDGNWVIGESNVEGTSTVGSTVGSNAAGTCVCSTICPPERACDGTLHSKKKVGSQLCGLDRKTRICQSNMNAPPEWTFGKKCVCAGDPTVPEEPTIQATQVAPAAKDNTILYAGMGFFFLFIMLIVIAFMLSGSSKSGSYSSVDKMHELSS